MQDVARGFDPEVYRQLMQQPQQGLGFDPEMAKKYGQPPSHNLGFDPEVARAFVNQQQPASGMVHGAGKKDSVPAMVTPGEYVLPRDTVQAVGVDNLEALRAATHTQQPVDANVPRGFNPQHFFANGGLVDDEEAQKANKVVQGQATPSAAGTPNATAQPTQTAANTPTGGAYMMNGTTSKPQDGPLDQMARSAYQGVKGAIQSEYQRNQEGMQATNQRRMEARQAGSRPFTQDELAAQKQKGNSAYMMPHNNTQKQSPMSPGMQHRMETIQQAYDREASKQVPQASASSPTTAVQPTMSLQQRQAQVDKGKGGAVPAGADPALSNVPKPPETMLNGQVTVTRDPVTGTPTFSGSNVTGGGDRVSTVPGFFSGGENSAYARGQRANQTNREIQQMLAGGTGNGSAGYGSQNSGGGQALVIGDSGAAQREERNRRVTYDSRISDIMRKSTTGGTKTAAQRRAETQRIGQQLAQLQSEMRDGVTMRGQDLSAEQAALRDATQRRAQDLGHQTNMRRANLDAQNAAVSQQLGFSRLGLEQARDQRQAQEFGFDLEKAKQVQALQNSAMNGKTEAERQKAIEDLQIAMGRFKQPQQQNWAASSYQDAMGGQTPYVYDKNTGQAKAIKLSSAETPPAVGDVQNGYRFKGGNPAKQQNWEKV